MGRDQNKFINTTLNNSLGQAHGKCSVLTKYISLKFLNNNTIPDGRQ